MQKEKSSLYDMTGNLGIIPADMLHRTWQELEYRLDILRATKGAHIEVY
jgi:hypothetical protein